MLTIAIGRMLRMLRVRKEWRQLDVAIRAKLSAAAIGRHENGSIGSLASLERHAAVFGLRLDVRVTGRAGQLVRLADEEHAAIVESLAAWFRDAGFLVEPEASFSEWGERGRIDLLAYDPRTGVLIIVEVKTQLLDLQDLFGSLNVKERLAATIAERRGWSVRRRVVVLAAASSAANREVVRGHAALFGGFERRKLTVAALRTGGERLLHWVSPDVAARRSWIAGRQRVRRARRPHLSSDEAYDGNADPGATPGPISPAG